MRYIAPGTTDLEVSVICLGCWAFANDKMWGAQDDQASIATIHAALDAGINFLDTAEGYGNGYSEQVVGQAIKGRRDKVIVATKVKGGNLAPDNVMTACENSLERLQTDYIDLYQIHWPNRDVPLADTLDALLRLQEQGKIRHIGVSNFGIQDMTDALAITPIVSNQVVYSLLARGIEYEVLPYSQDHQIGVLCYSPLMHGLLTGKYKSADDFPVTRARTRHFSSQREHAAHDAPGCEQETFEAVEKIRGISAASGYPMSQLALAWTLQQPGITSTIAGARTVEQVTQIAGAGDIHLPDSVLQELSDVTEPVKHALGASIDLWKTESRAR